MYTAPECAYEFEGKHIKTPGEIRHKVTGTMIGGILGLSPFTTPFQVACELLGLGREDISDKPAVKRGKALEGKIIKYAGETWPEYGTWLDAEEVFQNRGDNPHAAPSDFEDEVFAGHCDGILMTDDGEEYIIEIKTTANYDSWKDGVPKYYYWQTAIYDYFLTKKGIVYFVLGLATPNTDRDPYSWIANSETVYKYDEALDTADIEEKIQMIREWYDTYIKNGITPDYDPENAGDVELYNHLIAVATSDQQREQAVDRINELTKKINELKVTSGILEYEDQLADLKKQLRDVMTTLDLSEIKNTDKDFHATLSKTTNSTFSEEKMVADNIDPKKYKVETVSYTLRTNNIKK